MTRIKNKKDKPCQSALEKQIRIATSLRDTLSVLNSDRDLEEILDYIVIQAQTVLDADAVAIYAPHESDGLLHIQASHGLPQDYVTTAKIPYGIAATGYATMTGKPVSIEDTRSLSSEPGFPMDEERNKVVIELSKNYRALLAIPLIFSKGNTYGTLDLYFSEPHHFLEEELTLARAYSDQTILAIENARLRENDKKTAVLSERHRLARDLHDTVTQSLFSASLISDVLPDLWENNQEVGRTALEELRKLSRGALAEMRTLLFELRPGALINADMEQLVQQLVDAFVSRTRYDVVFDRHAIECNIPVDTKTAIYRITQELLHNIERHADASKVHIYFGKVQPHVINQPDNQSSIHYKSRICLSIQDNGRGFDPDTISYESMGLRIVRERAESIGANLKIESGPWMGTTIELIW
jgi:signal transduction histidine kinase